MATHSPDAILYNLPDNRVIVQGETAIREHYTGRFQNPMLKATVTNRMVIGNRVIDHESVIGIDPDSPIEVVAIYEIENNLIQRVWFIYN